MFCYCHIEVYSFLMRDRIGMDLDERGGGEGLGGAKGGDAVIFIHCMRK